MGGLATQYTNHQQHIHTMSTANYSASKYRNQAQKLEEKQSCGAHQTDNGMVGWGHQIHTSRQPRMIINHMYTRLYQAPCQLCLTTSLQATDGISHEGPRFFTLVQPWRTSLSFLVFKIWRVSFWENVLARSTQLQVKNYVEKIKKEPQPHPWNKIGTSLTGPGHGIDANEDDRASAATAPASFQIMMQSSPTEHKSSTRGLHEFVFGALLPSEKGPRLCLCCTESTQVIVCCVMCCSSSHNPLSTLTGNPSSTTPCSFITFRCLNWAMFVASASSFSLSSGVKTFFNALTAAFTIPAEVCCNRKQR